MTKINMRRTRFLDGERIFRLYYTELGSARSIGKVKIQLGRDAINPRTGRNVNDMALWGSMYRWAMNRLDDSYKIFMDAMRDEGKYHTFEEWKEFIFDKADILVRHNPRTLRNWKNRVGQE
jgi:hypothetical protein